MLPNRTLALYLLSLALRPCHDETREFVKINRRDLDGSKYDGISLQTVNEIASSAVRYDDSTGNVYLTRPEIHESAWEALFPGLDLEGLMCEAMDGGYALGVPLGDLEKLPPSVTRRSVTQRNARNAR